MWDLLDRKVVRSHDVVFMEDKTIEDWRQQKLVSSSQSTIVMESRVVDPPSTQPVGRQQSADEVESKSADTQQLAYAYESESEDKLAEETESQLVAEG